MLLSIYEHEQTITVALQSFVARRTLRKNFSLDGNTVYFIALFRQYSVALNIAVCPLAVPLLGLNVHDEVCF